MDKRESNHPSLGIAVAHRRRIPKRNATERRNVGESRNQIIFAVKSCKTCKATKDFPTG